MKCILVVGFQVVCSCLFQRLAFFILWPMREANSVSTILGFTSTKSSGSAYTRAPILRANEIAYLGEEQEEREVRRRRSDDKYKDAGEGNNCQDFVFYMALLCLSASFIHPFSPLFTMSHLTFPGAMASIRSITGRLVLISLSCRKRQNRVKCSLVFIAIHHALTHTHTHTLKLLICVSLRFWLKVVLTQPRMI